MALSPAPRMLIASMLWETAQSRREHRIRRGGEEEKAEDLLYLKRAIGGPHVLLSGLCSAPLCVQSNKQSVRNMAGGARKENRRERGTALCMSAVTQTTRQGLTAIMPTGAAWW